MADTRVKICGINSREAYDAAATADWVGFVFLPASPRAVTPQQAADLVRPNGPSPVGLFVEPTDQHIADTLKAVRLDVLQLIAAPERVADIRRIFGLPVWRAIGVNAAEDLPSATQGEDALLLDARPPQGAELPGGNAKTFDWSVLRDWTPPGPWLLAGGLTPDNAAAAIAQTGAPAVDVSSGVERARGVKDPARIAAFIRAVRGG